MRVRVICFVIVDHCCVIANFAKHWLCDRYRLKFISVLVDCFYHLIVLSAMHQMSRLNNQVLNTVCNCTVKSLLHVVNVLIFSCLYMVDDDPGRVWSVFVQQRIFAFF